MRKNNLDKKKLLQRVDILNIPVDVSRNAKDESLKLYSQGGGQIITLNTEMIIDALSDANFKNVIEEAELIIPDSIGVIIGLKLRGYKSCRKPGIDLAWELLCNAEKNNWRVVLVGGDKIVINRLIEKFNIKLPNLDLVISSHGYITKSQSEKLLMEIVNVQPDMIIAAKGSPAQEKLLYLIKSYCKDCLLIGVGGSFDVWSGKFGRAPLLVQQIGLEWLFRLLIDFKRWDRFIKLPLYLILIILEWVKNFSSGKKA